MFTVKQVIFYESENPTLLRCGELNSMVGTEGLAQLRVDEYHESYLSVSPDEYLRIGEPYTGAMRRTKFYGRDGGT